MGNTKRMDQIRAILKTYQHTQSYQATARQLGISRNTVKTHIKRLNEVWDDLGALLALDDQALYAAVYPAKEVSTNSKLATLQQQIPYWLKELKRVGVTRQLLWQEYKAKHPDGFGYTQFCLYIKRAVSANNLSIAMRHPPGECMQVDFAGKKLSWVDPHTAEVISCEVFVAVMPHSQKTFVLALESQRVAHFIHGFNQALLFFGGLPKVILSDNLKSYVTKTDRYDPKFNELCVQLSAHYLIDLSATRVAKPKDKASVENMVSTIYTRIYAVLRNDIFHSIEALNRAIRQALEVHNNQPYQKKSGTRCSVFEAIEAPQLRPLPSEIFEVKKTTQSKVRKDYHVTLGEDQNYYSVPFQYVGKQATLLYTSKIVEVYIDNQRVATHQRFSFQKAYKHVTELKHMPKNHQEWVKAQGLDAAYFIKKAARIGKATQWAIQHILTSKFHEAQAFNSCQGVLRLAKTFGEQRLEKAAARSQETGTTNYGMLRRILINRMDMSQQDDQDFKTPKHDNIRGPQSYQ